MDVHVACTSETGKAIDLAREFVSLLKSKQIVLKEACALTEKVVFRRGIWVLFVSTTGQGQYPHLMRSLWKAMMRKGYKVEE